MTTIRVIIADDHSGVRKSIRQLLEKTPDIQVVGEADSGVGALRLVEQLAADLLLLDMAMPDLSGVEVAHHLFTAHSPIRILALSAYSDEQYVSGVLANGAAGYLTKDEAIHHLVEAVRYIAHGGQGWFSPKIKSRINQQEFRPPYQRSPAVLLTNREQEILLLLIQGASEQEIANRLALTSQIIQFHLKNICNKFQVKTMEEARAYALRQNLL